jgi:DnaJ-class molecular chaperone
MVQIIHVGFIDVVKGFGMPKHLYPDEKGDLFVTYQVVMPVSLNKEQQTTIKDVL